MNILAVNLSLNANKPANVRFKGFMGESVTEILEQPYWCDAYEVDMGTYHTLTTYTYYKFSDDTQEELNKILSEYTYSRKEGPDSLD